MPQQSKIGFLLLIIPFIIFSICLKCVTAPRYIGGSELLVKSANIDCTPKKSLLLEADNPVILNSIDSCSNRSKISDRENKKENQPIFSQIGLATYYANKFQGRYTAFGEKYDKNKFTAAHFSLPYNTMVKVTCLDNKKVVLVRINDRCHKWPNRIIDLSRISAEEIGIIKRGVAKVKIEVFNNP